MERRKKEEGRRKKEKGEKEGFHHHFLLCWFPFFTAVAKVLEGYGIKDTKHLIVASDVCPTHRRELGKKTRKEGRVGRRADEWKEGGRLERRMDGGKEERKEGRKT